MRLILIVTWLLSLIGCSESIRDKSTLFKKRRLTDAEQTSIAVESQHALQELNERYSDGRHREPIDLLQMWFDDGSFNRTRDLTSFGYLWGNILVKEAGWDWVVAQFEGMEYFGLSVPSTSITIAPISMLEKRQDRGDQIDFREFLLSTIDAVQVAKANPEYQRP